VKAAGSEARGIGPEPGRNQLPWSVAARMFGQAYLVAVGSMDPGNWAGELRAPGWLQVISWLCAAAIVIVNVSLLTAAVASIGS
jgi:Mn2+/Fe2+ NRAMP family transporter